MTGDGYSHEIVELLGNCRIGFLATQGRHGPETSMAPYALHGGGILLHLSGLARHTANVAKHPQSGFMICTPETAMDSPLGLPRMSLQGRVNPVPPKAIEAAKSIYMHAIHDAAPLFDFPDFRLFSLDPVRIHWVGGFGKARNIPPSTWLNICANLVPLADQA